MTSVFFTLLSLLALAGVGFVRRWQAKKDGRKEEKLNQAQKTLKGIRDGQNAVIRARNDRDIADKLRDRYDIE